MKRVKHLRKLVRLLEFGRCFQLRMKTYRMEEYGPAKAKFLMHRVCALNYDYEDRFYNLHIKISNRSVPQLDGYRHLAY